ncbi:MAG: hypothetical protein PHT03_04690 [Bacilli bacterium]|nr:hypothetical protein [Bacilli bacterium]
MKKKLLFLFILVFSLFVVVGCDGENGDDGKYEGTEFLAAPVNLAINDKNKVLSWNTVEHATKYEVYVNGKKKTTVTETSYDFSNLKGDYITFYIVATGVEYSQSAKSLTIAYQANSKTEISAVISVADNLEMEIDLNFANEIVKRGITSEQFSADAHVLQNFFEAMEASDGPDDIKAAFSAFLAADIEIEAYVAGFMKYLQPILESQYDLIIDLTEKEMLGVIMDMYNQEYENLVMAVSNTVQYLFDIYSYCADDVFNLINNDNDDIKPETIIAIKDEIVDTFLEKMPNVRDLSLLYRLYASFVEVQTGKSDMTIAISGSASVLANVTVLQFEFFLKLLKTYDLAFYQSFQAKTAELQSDNAIAVEAAIMAVKQYQQFLNNNKILKDKIDNALTEKQKSDLVLGSIKMQFAMMEDLLGIQLEFDQELYLKTIDIFEKLGDKFLDYFAASDGNLLREITIQSGYTVSYDYYNYTTIYINTVTRITYEDENEWQLAKKLTTCEILKEIVALYNATAAQLTDADFAILIEYIFYNLEVVASAQSVQSALFALLPTLGEFVIDHASVLRELLNNLAAYLAENAVFKNLGDTFTAICEHFAAVSGVETNYDGKEYERNSLIIFFAKNFEPFYTQNKNTIETLVNDVFVFLKAEASAGNIELTVDEIEQYETFFNDILDSTIPLLQEIKTFDPNNLNEYQLGKLNDFKNLFS